MMTSTTAQEMREECECVLRKAIYDMKTGSFFASSSMDIDDPRTVGELVGCKCKRRGIITE
jgi:hypothetical protein